MDSPVPTLLVVGCGRMGAAIAECALKGKIARVAAVDERMEEIAPSLTFAAELDESFDSLESVAASQLRYDYVLFAVKPQQLEKTLRDYVRYGLKNLPNGACRPCISVAAGAKVAVYKEILGSASPVVRAMPNLAMTVGAGATGFFASSETGGDVIEFVRTLFSQGGVAFQTQSEELIDAVTAISGSGPAYFFYFAECLAEAGEKAGLPRDVALALAKHTLCGAGRLAESGALSALREQVASPGGTTEAALQTLTTDNLLRDAVKGAVDAALARAKELATGIVSFHKAHTA